MVEKKLEIIPPFEFGLLNAWIFMIWLVIIPILSNFMIREEEVSRIIKTSVPMKFEKTFNIISMAAVILAFIYSIFLPFDYYTVWFIIGFLIFIFGLFVYISVLFTIRDAQPGKPFMNGLYRYSRHPIYLGNLLILISVLVMTLSWILLIFVIIIIVHLILAMPAEEKYCLEKYGEDYKNYLNRTPRLLGLPRSDK